MVEVVAVIVGFAVVDRPAAAASASVEPFRKNELLHPHVAPTNINDSISYMDNIVVWKQKFDVVLWLWCCVRIYVSKR